MEFETGHQYEYDKTKIALDSLKKKIAAWLKTTYGNPEDADFTYNYMKDYVDKIVKRQPHTISWVSAGDPDWHGKYYHFMSRWIKLENELGVITSRMFFLDECEDECE